MAKAIKNQLPDSNIPQAFYLRTNRKQMKLSYEKLENNTYNSKIIFKLSL